MKRIIFPLLLSILLAAGLLRPVYEASMAADTFTFTAAGDHGVSNYATESLKQIGALGPSFHLALGDLSYGGPDSEPGWCQYVKDKINAGAGRLAGDPFGENFPFELVSGNHEDQGGLLDDGDINNFAACLPDRIGGLTGAYAKEYYFDYQGLARIIQISPKLTIDGQLYIYTLGNAHYNWLRDAIDGARAAGIPWIVVGMHQDCLTMGVKPCAIGANLVNLLVEKRVDLVLQGHDHTYQRSKQLALNPLCAAIQAGAYNPDCVADDGSDHHYVKDAGTLFVINGSSGAGLYDLNTADPEAPYFAAWMGNNVEPSHGNLVITVSSSELLAEFRPSVGAFTDNFTISQSEIPTPTPVPTSTPPPPPVTVSLNPIEDTYVHSGRPAKNYGAWTTFLVDGSPVKIGYLKFDLSSLSGVNVVAAKLRIKVANDASKEIQIVKRVDDTSWGELTMTYSNKPPLLNSIASFLSPTAYAWVEVDVTSEVLARQGQLMSLGIDEVSGNGVNYYSRENLSDQPLLVVDYTTQ